MSMLDGVVKLYDMYTNGRNGGYSGEYIDENSLAKLKFLTKRQQERLARRIFGDIVKKASRVPGMLDDVATDAPALEEILMSRYMRMPENIRDSFLISAIRTPVKFGVASKNGGPAFDWSDGNVYIPNVPREYLNGKSILEEIADELTHELGHSTMKGITGVKDFVPVDGAVNEGLGKTFTDELGQEFVFGNNVPKMDRDIIAQIRRDELSKIENQRLASQFGKLVLDHVRTEPRNMVFMDDEKSNPPMLKRYSNGMSKTYGDFGKDDVQNPEYAATSLEDAANTFNVVGVDGGDEKMMERFPKFYESLKNIVDKDKRKTFFIPPINYWGVYFPWLGKRR